MNAQEFVACWKKEKDAQLHHIFQESSFLGKQLHELNLTVEQHDKLAGIVNGLLTDFFIPCCLVWMVVVKLVGFRKPLKFMMKQANLFLIVVK
jgi:hypothetical protein